MEQCLFTRRTRDAGVVWEEVGGWQSAVTDRCCRAPWCSLVPKCGILGVSRLPLLPEQHEAEMS